MEYEIAECSLVMHLQSGFLIYLSWIGFSTHWQRNWKTEISLSGRSGAKESTPVLETGWPESKIREYYYGILVVLCMHFSF